MEKKKQSKTLEIEIPASPVDEGADWENTSLETALTVHLQNKNTACWKFEHFFRRNGKEGDFFCILFLY